MFFANMWYHVYLSSLGNYILPTVLTDAGKMPLFPQTHLETNNYAYRGKVD